MTNASKKRPVIRFHRRLLADLVSEVVYQASLVFQVFALASCGVISDLSMIFYGPFTPTSESNRSGCAGPAPGVFDVSELL